VNQLVFLDYCSYDYATNRGVLMPIGVILSSWIPGCQNVMQGRHNWLMLNGDIMLDDTINHMGKKMMSSKIEQWNISRRELKKN
jgi:hypothetical protein